jgi:signal transduction histidine kinase/DNA-binding response OmpR family regulator
LLPQPALPNARQRAIEALDRVRQEFNEHSRLQTARKLFQHMDMSNRLSLLTAQLMSVRKESEITAILREHLGPIRLRRVAVVLLEPDGPDTIGRSRVLLQAGEGEESGEQNFITRHFPPPGFCPGLTPFQLALLPLVVDEQTNGYMVFDAANLEPCGSMVRNLASALRSLALYRQAIEGRRLAEEANQLKSRFLSMVSHELRTPLNLIVGLSEMLLRQKDQAPVPTENLWQDLERIFNSAQHLGWLISDVLDLASSEAGQLRLIREPLDLTEVLQVVAVTGEQLAHGKDLIWEARLPSSGPWVLGDRTRLRQVALNFISNAVKFTEYGKVTMEVTTQDDQVAVAISDTGLGVPVEEQAEIFNEFHCSEVSIKRGYGGIGLGLAISRQLVELHQGTIGLYSSGKEGSGSTFFFMLPIIHPQEASRETDTEQPAYHLSIALLTEQVETFAPLADQLTGQGIEVKVYPVGKDPSWLPKLLVSKPGAVILDEQLASRQGWEILCVLKRHKPTQQVPVMVHSYDLKEDHGTLLELNYLQKPLSPDHLAEMLYSRGLLNKGDSSIRTILVVDDEPGTLDFNTRLIQQQVINCKVLQARNGREALTIIRESLPDLVLLDLMMPELDGFGVLEAMRENDQTRNIAVVVLTAKSLPEADMARLNRGVAAILNKGMFSSKEIVDHIEGALSKSLTPGSAAPKMVRKAVAYIHENYQEPLTREQIAEYIGINADYLTVCFNHELGIPPMTYLSRYRITRARTLLETQEKNITEIAMEVGFSDSAYFSRIFQRETGVSPRAYQRGVRAPG